MARVIRVGMSYSKKFKIVQDDVTKFGDLVHDHNPIHSDPVAAKKAGFPAPLCYGAFASSLFSGIGATHLPGPYSVAMSNKLRYFKPIFIGEEIELKSEVKKFRRDKNLIAIATEISKIDPVTGEKIICLAGSTVSKNDTVKFEGETPEWTNDE